MKQHFEVLDGLRGTAALLMVAFHLLGSFFHNYHDNPLRHGYLAVDFFFLLSGFVVGYAYDDRWPALTVRDFLRLRPVRLHPLVVLSIAVRPSATGSTHTWRACSAARDYALC